MKATKATLEKYLKILKIELQDLENHIEVLLEDYHSREQKREVTEHVSLANTAVLRNEKSCIRHFINILDTIDLAEYANLDELVLEIENRFETGIRLAGRARAAYIFAQRKIHKVAQYME